MAEGKSTPPSQTLARRLRSLIANLDEASVESTAKQVSGWIDSLKDQDDRFRGLLRLSAELVLEKASERPDKGFHRALGRFSKILDTVTEGEYSGLLNMLWKEEIQAAGVELLANDMAEPGSWPEYLALVVFAGEVCDDGLLQPDALRDCARMLGGLGSNLGLELACTLLETTGQSIREDCHGERSLDTIIQAMLSASKGDGIPARIQNRVQELATQWASGLALPGGGLSDVQWDGETAIWSAREERPAKIVSKLCKPKHPKFYFESGDVIFVCEDTSFRVQSDLLSNNSKVLSDMLASARSNVEHLSDGCLCVHLSDAVNDFATLLRVFYTSGFPNRHKTPDFATFSSLLQMATKYRIQELRSQILLDLHPAYPTELSEYKASYCLGEAVFGIPLPHPNSVLDLFVKSEVAFALPFAYYRVCIAGDPASLETTDPEVALPPDTLKAALRGQARLRAEEVQLARKVVVQDCTSKRPCSGQLPASRTQVFDWIHVATQSGILEKGDPPESVYCIHCQRSFKRELSKAKEDTWKNLPTYFGLPPWKNATNRSTWFFPFL